MHACRSTLEDPTFLHGAAALALDGGFEVAGKTLTIDSSNAVALVSVGAVTNTWSGNIVLQRHAGIHVAEPDGAFTHFGGVGQFDSSFISGPGGFTKSGPGAMFVNGFLGGNSYAGPTTVLDGLLQAQRPRALAGAILVSGTNAVLRTGRVGGLFSAATVLPAGVPVTVQDGAAWAMNGTNFEAVSRLVGDGQLNLGSGAVLTVSNEVSFTFAGAIAGSGELHKRGQGTFQVTSPYSYNYTGTATVFSGTYEVLGDHRNNPVTVKPAAVLRGSGGLSNVTVEAGGVVRVDQKWSGLAGGALGLSAVNFQPGGAALDLDFFGPSAAGGNDFLYVGGPGPVTLGNPGLSARFLYPPREGDVVTLIDNTSSGAVSGLFDGFPAGGLAMIGPIPVVPSYTGGDGNDVTLTVTNLPLRGGGAPLVAGLADGVLVPGDCRPLWVAVTNRSGAGLANLRGTLRSLTEGVLVTGAESAFPHLAPDARGTNATPFQIRTEPPFRCGDAARFELVLTGSNMPSMAIAYELPGALGYALEFDGRDDARVAAAPNAFAGMVNNFTMELWANPRANRTPTAETNTGVSGVSLPLRQIQRFAVFPDRGNIAYGPTHVSAGLSIGRNGISAYEQGTNHLPSRLVYSNALSGWTHVALVYANRQPRLYVNGALVRSGSASVFANVHPSASLGGSLQADYGNFDGQLDEVRIWNVARSQAEIQAGMSRTMAGNEPGLVVYFRCNEGGGNALADAAPAAPSITGALAAGASFVAPGALPPGDLNCTGGGACESCLRITTQFAADTPTIPAPLSPEGAPSICFPPKACPGPFPVALPPTRFRQHSFTNAGGTEACVTAQLRFDCPAAPRDALHVAAYLGAMDPANPCLNYLGDSGGDGTVPFSFPVPAGSNVVIVVTSWTPGIGCDAYALELFGLPCPAPRLDIARDTAPDKVVLRWSSAYPDYFLQAANLLGSPGSFSNVSTAPVLVTGQFAVTNAATVPREFFRLAK